MTQTRRQWIATFADPAVLSDLFAAARDAMRQICDHAPEDCNCELNRATFQEWAEWVELEVERERGKPVRFEPGYRPRRKDDERPPTLNLAIAG